MSLSLITCDPTIAEKHGNGHGSYDQPRFCLQRVYYDVPGSNYDFYECLTYPDGCDLGVEYYSDFWYGLPNPANMNFPQICDQNSPQTCNCEAQNYRADSAPGHGLILDTRDKARRATETGMVLAGVPTTGMVYEYFKIPADKVSGLVTGAVPVVSVKVPSPTVVSPEGTLYFCLQMEETGESPTVTAVFNRHATQCTCGGKLIRIKFKVGAEDRVAVVWLKEAGLLTKAE
jgi:hypothetical protein